MTIRHLKIFIAVAETQSMSAAAQKLYISQPTVSQTIHELEDHYQALLFERLSRKLYITDKGKQLLSLAYQTVDRFDSLESSMQDQHDISTLRIGSSMTVGTCLMPQVITKLQEKCPKLDIYSTVNNTNEIEKLLLKSQLDVAVVEGNIKSPDLVYIPIINDWLVLACSNMHEFYHRDHITSKELENQRFATREEGSGTRQLFEQYLQKRGIHVKFCWEANCPRSILNFVLRNNTLTVMSSRLMRHEIEKDRLKIFRVENEEWERTFKLVYHKNKFLTPEINELKKILMAYTELLLPKEKTLATLSDD
ncbi:MAG: LysR family transcriptional regulator [Clostridia bacterium]|nr:LysR family transcriptional regulator [Clostridia bacterium]NCC43352.1 LysR family transcriptional regulator [Clostridia bacterium]